MAACSGLGTLTPVALGMGSNVGDRLAHLRRGVEAVARWIHVDAVSSVYESRAVGYRDQPDFLNLVVIGRTDLGPTELLARTRMVEAEEGRRRSFRNAPRTLDIDLLLFGDRVESGNDLHIPHPRWAERSFVLAPLCEIAPTWMDPASGLTVVEQWHRREPVLEPVRVVAPPGAVWSAG
ncbi:MAG: 2-amino-4-hydroxy-6-hydroxymethyldihydropteridine diphosphokinase [Gemmatimonadetes bacterium]|nr:2-amino-4-hydroxy-6-hydroxymethyldihydropteridine diphosphokinase [Gemmatimonadota bacterium]